MVLRCHAPQPIAEAWQRAISGLNTEEDKLGWRLGFADVTLRFLVAVIAADHAGLGLAAPDNLAKLLGNKLATPSWGDWKSVGMTLAGEVLAKGGACAPQIAALMERDSEFMKHLGVLIDARNDVAHSDGRLHIGLREVREWSPKIEEPLREISRSLQVFRHHPVVVLESCTESALGDAFECRMTIYSGLEPYPHRVSAPARIELPPQPVLLSADGSALVLNPFIVAEPNRATDLREIRCLDRWNPKKKQLEYSDPRGGRRGPADFASWAPEQLVAFHRTNRARRSPLLADLHSDLDGPRAEGLELPGLIIEKRIGRGASSTVYLGRMRRGDRPPGEHVAIKVLHPIVAMDKNGRDRFQREYEILARLHHPGIVKVRDLSEEPRPHLVMDYVDGNDLQSEVEVKRNLSPKVAARLAIDVLHALEVAHAAGVVHRDVKPSNVIVDRAGSVRLVDFGIATAEHLARLTATVEAVGTTSFAAPEQLAGRSDVDERADLFAVGKLIEFLVLGPLHRRTPDDDLPAGLQAVLRKACNRDAELRFASAQDMRLALEERLSAGLQMGAPIQQGDVIATSYELLELSHHAPEGIWFFDGRELATGRECAVAAAVRKTSGDEALLAAVASHAERTGIHPPVAFDTDLVYAVLRTETDGRRAHDVLLGSAAELAPSDGLTSPASGAPYLAPLLRRLEGIGRQLGSVNPRTVILIVFEMVPPTLATLVAQLRVRRGEPPALRTAPPPTLGHWASTLRRELKRHRDLKTAAGVLEAVDELAAGRNAWAHSSGKGVASLPIQVEALGRCLYFAQELASDIEPAALAPVVMNVHGRWRYLVNVRNESAHYLDQDLADEHVLLIREPGLAHLIRVTEMEVVANTLTALRERFSWAQIRAERKVDLGSHPGFVDLVLQYKGTVKLAVEVRRPDALGDHPSPAVLEQLGRYVDALEVDLGAVTDGHRWWWYRNDSKLGLTQLAHDPEAGLNDVPIRLDRMVEDDERQNAWGDLAALDGEWNDRPAIEPAQVPPPETWAARVQHGMSADGLDFPIEVVATVLAGMATRRLCMIEGPPGSGKTSLVRALGREIGAQVTNIAVRANWSDPTDLVGYNNVMAGRFVATEFTTALYRAGLPKNVNRPWFILLDEVNLARFEGYFGDALHALENDEPSLLLTDEKLPFSPPNGLIDDGRRIPIPPNVWFFGTANYDETTYGLTDKVVDRAVMITLAGSLQFASSASAEREPMSLPAASLGGLGADDPDPTDRDFLTRVLEALEPDTWKRRFDLTLGLRTLRQALAMMGAISALGLPSELAADHMVATLVLRPFANERYRFNEQHRPLIRQLQTVLEAVWIENRGTRPVQSIRVLEGCLANIGRS